ncbi:hypothetical protein Tco_0880945 [Tanacetum coccineum]
MYRIMNPQETEQVVARDELWVPTAERVNISTTNVRLETTVKQKEETFQVLIDLIKNSTCIKAFTISADVPEILMQQFWYTITKIKDSDSYEFLLADKKCVIDAKVFRKILDIYFKLFKFNKGMENKKWNEDDKRRSEDFIEVIERRLKIRRIFQSLESFVGGRLRDIDYRLISRTE